MRYFFHIGYHGYAYQGWQRQLTVRSVQEIIEDVFANVLGEPVTVMGCGRTDTRVHASQYFFHADIMREWDFDLLFRLNKNLPDDIAIFEIIPMADDQHARFDAAERTYDYFIHTYKDPFLSHFSACYLLKNLRLDLMKEAVALLPHYQDYRAFCKTPDDNRNTLVKIKSATLFTDVSGDRIRFQITANRFLGKMIRLIVGNLLMIGRGQLTVEEFENKLITREIKPVLAAYPQGLYLSKITYPYLDIPPRTEFTTMLSVGEWVAV
jgi:tRNA pseudouridine38-40 synthase